MWMGYDVIKVRSQLFRSHFSTNAKSCRYFGRKRLETQDEKWIKNSELLVKAGYSYWTLGYVLTLLGAQKLLGSSIHPILKAFPHNRHNVLKACSIFVHDH